MNEANIVFIRWRQVQSKFEVVSWVGGTARALKLVSLAWITTRSHKKLGGATNRLSCFNTYRVQAGSSAEHCQGSSSFGWGAHVQRERPYCCIIDKETLLTSHWAVWIFEDDNLFIKEAVWRDSKRAILSGRIKCHLFKTRRFPITRRRAPHVN